MTIIDYLGSISPTTWNSIAAFLVVIVISYGIKQAHTKYFGKKKSQDTLAIPEDKTAYSNIVPDSPINDAERDCFQFKPYVDTFVSLVTTKKNETPFTIVIDGDWGTGKTSLMKLTEKSLEKYNFKMHTNKPEDYKNIHRSCLTVWFNAWKYSTDDHIFVALLLEMFKTIEKNSTLYESFKTKIDYQRLLVAFLNFLYKPFLKKDVSTFFHELRLKQKSSSIYEATELMKQIINNSTSKKNSHKESPDTVFVIFVDDLDRCPPVRVRQVMEAISLFLDIKGCIFFLGMEFKKIEEILNAEYKNKQKIENFDANVYLDKIFQIRVKIPPVSPTNMSTYWDRIFEDIKENDSEKENEHNDEIKEVFLAAGFNSQRALKRAINDYLFLKSICHTMEDVDLNEDNGE